jgi:thymidylate kinase
MKTNFIKTTIAKTISFMLITFSGIVGSGKSTNAKYVRDLMADSPDQPVYLRFRFLSWRKMLANSSQKRARSNRDKKEVNRETPRTNKVMPLTLVRFAGYLVRMLNFHLLKQIKLRNRVAICDRYFYDNLAHYHLKNRRERFYFKILRKAMPKPDICFMLMAEPETILQRRGHYESNYIYTLSENYKKMAGAFSNLIVVKTDETKEIGSSITRHIRDRMNENPKGKRCHYA